MLPTVKEKERKIEINAYTRVLNKISTSYKYILYFYAIFETGSDNAFQRGTKSTIMTRRMSLTDLRLRVSLSSARPE